MNVVLLLSVAVAPPDVDVVAATVNEPPVGATVSIFTESVPVLALPALSDTEHDTACVPLLDTDTLYGLDEPDTVAALPSTVQVGFAAIPLPASDTATDTLTDDDLTG